MKKEPKKTSKLTKIVCAAVLATSAFAISGCEVYYESTTYPRKYYLGRDYPDHLRGTLLDPYPPARRGYGIGIIITPRYRKGTRAPQRPSRPYTPRQRNRR